MQPSSATETSAHQASIHQPGHGVDQEEGTHEDQESRCDQPIEQDVGTEDLALGSYRPQTIMRRLLQASTGVHMRGRESSQALAT